MTIHKEIISEFNKAFENIMGPCDLLALLRAWGNELDDAETLDLVGKFNAGFSWGGEILNIPGAGETVQFNLGRSPQEKREQ